MGIPFEIIFSATRYFLKTVEIFPLRIVGTHTDWFHEIGMPNIGPQMDDVSYELIIWLTDAA